MHEKNLKILNKKRKNVSLILLIIFGCILSMGILEVFLRVVGFGISAHNAYLNQIKIDNNSNQVNILALGESTTANLYNGQGTWPEELENILNNGSSKYVFNVFNEGMVGARTVYFSDNIEKWIDAYNPGIVIAMIGINDPPAYNKFESPIISKISSFFQDMRVIKLFRWLLETWKSILFDDMIKDVAGLPYENEDIEFFQSSDCHNYSLMENTIIYRIDGEKDDDLKELEVFDSKLPCDVTVIRYLANLYNQKNESKKAEALLFRALNMNNESIIDDIFTYSNLGQFYYEKHEYTKAIEMLSKAISITIKEDPRMYYHIVIYSQTMIALARAYHKVEDYEKMESVVYNLSMIKDHRLYKLIAGFYSEIGKNKEALEFIDKANKIKNEYSNTFTKKNYLKLYDTLERRGIPLIAMQYPMKEIESLKRIFPLDSNIIFVSNEDYFKELVKKEGYGEYFVDSFAEDFGHCTLKGNKLIAKNVAKVIIEEI